MVKIINELIDKLDREEITNLQCIKMHGQEMVNTYKEWCQVLGFQEGDEDGAEQFVNELRYGDEPDDGDLPEEVWGEFKDIFNKEPVHAYKNKNGNENPEDQLSPMELFEKWKKDKGRLDSLKNSINAVKITLWRYQNPLATKRSCSKALDITRKNVIKWWNIRYFIDAALADGGHVHPIRLDYDTIKKTIIQAVDKAEQG